MNTDDFNRMLDKWDAEDRAHRRFGAAFCSVLFLLALIALASGCKISSGKFIKLNPDGSTNYVAREFYGTLLIVGEASNLKAEVLTPDYVRAINADRIGTRGDAESISATGTAAGNLLNKALNPAP